MRLYMLLQPLLLLLFSLPITAQETTFDSSTDAATLTHLPSQTGTFTTLPPAQPSGNNTDPCGFHDRDSLVNQVVTEWNHYNVSLLVETCPNVCILIFGTGNPDVSGIGALISYLLQFVSYMMTGPLVYMILCFDYLLADRFRQFLHFVRTKIALDINVGNTNIMVAILVAAAVRNSQQPPAFELDFLNYLVWFQCLLAFGRIAVTLGYSNGGNHTHSKQAYIYFTTALGFFVTLFVSGTSYPGGASGDALQAISQYCVHLNDIPIPIKKPKTPEKHYSFKEIVIGTLWGILYSAAAIIASIVLYIVMYLIILALGFVIEILWKHLLRHIMSFIWHFVLKPIAGLINLSEDMKNSLFLFAGLSFIMSLWLLGCVILMVYMQNARKSLQNALGSAYQDSVWGFGQVAAVVMWFPVVWDLLVRVCTFKPSVTETYEMQSLSGPDGGADVVEQIYPDAEDVELNFEIGDGEQETGTDQEILVRADQHDETTPTDVGQTVIQESDTGTQTTVSRSNTSDGEFSLTQRNTFPRNAAGTYLPHNGTL